MGKHRKSLLKQCVWIMMLIFLFLMYPLEGEATSADTGKQIAIIYRKEAEIEFLQKLVLACDIEAVVIAEMDYDKSDLEDVDYVITTSEKPTEDIKQARLQAIYLGKASESIPGSKLTEYQNISVKISNEDYQEKEKFEKKLSVITSTEGKGIGTIMLAGEKEMPFAVLADDGCYYIPFYREKGVSTVLMGMILQDLVVSSQEGKMYFLLDEVYPFSDLELLCDRADFLYKNGIPFLVRVMPIYENLDYPAFKRYAQILRYLQHKNGTIVIHPPIVISQQSEIEPLSDKMARFEKALTEENLHYRDFSNPPYLFTWEEIHNIETPPKNFGTLPFDSMFGITSETGDEEFEILMKQVNQKWLTIADYSKEFTTQKYAYYEEAIADDFVYRPKEEVAFSLFFSASDKILMVVVGLSLVIFIVFLLIGQGWYRKKFYK